MQFLNAAPDLGQYVLDIVATNMDWPGAQQLADRIKKTLPKNFLSVEDREKISEEEAAMEPSEPTPEQMAADQQIAVENAKAEAEMAKAEADQAKAKADIAMAEAKMKEAEAMMRAAGPDAEEHLRNMVASAIAEYVEEQGNG